MWENNLSNPKAIPLKKGSVNHGNLYEQQVMALLATALTNDDNVDNFEMITNPNKIESFDDIMLKVTYKDGKEVMFVIQVKHSVKSLKFTKNKEKPESDYLKIDVSKYFDSFMEIRELVMNKDPVEPLEEFLKSVTFDNYYFCIVTNTSEKQSQPMLKEFDISNLDISNEHLKLLNLAAEPLEKVMAAESLEKGLAAEPLEKGLAAEPLEKGLAAEPLEKGLAAEPLEKGLAAEPLEKGLATKSRDKYHQFNSDEFPSDDYQEFVKRLYIFCNQPDYAEITQRLILKVDRVNTFTQPMANYLYNLIAENRFITKQEKGTTKYLCNPLDKKTFVQFFVQVVLCHRVSIYMLQTEPIDENYIKEWDTICQQYQYILIDQNRTKHTNGEKTPKKQNNLLPLIAAYYEYRIRKFTKHALEVVLQGDSKSKEPVPIDNHQFTWNVCQQNCFQLDYYLRKALKKKGIQTANLIDLLLVMWKRNEIPIIVETSIAHVIKNLVDSNTNNRFFIISDDETPVDRQKTFRNLLDIRNGAAKDVFPKIMDMEVSLQGREAVRLKKIVRDNTETLKLISSSDFLGWIAKESKDRKVGMPLKDRVKYYRYRRFCLSNAEETIREIDIVNGLDGYNLTVISNDAGMGKSTVLTSLALMYDPTRYTIIYDLAQCKKDLEEKCSNIHSDPIRYFYNKMQTVENKLVKRILEQHLEEKKLVMFIDSFDEILPVHQDTVLNIIRQILSKHIHVFVTSRSQAGHLLNFNSIKSKNVHLTSLDSTEITKYFKNCNVPEDVWRKLPETFLSTPLHLNMLRKIYAYDKENNMNEMNETVLYKRFIERKILIFYRKKKIFEHHTQYSLRQVVDGILNAHYEIALVYLFGLEKTDDLKIVTNEQWDRTKNKFNDYQLSLGIVSQISPTIKFNHKTFSEYLAAEYIKSNPKKTIELYRDVVKGLTLYQTYKFLHEMRSSCNGQEKIEAYIVQDNMEKVKEKMNLMDWNEKDPSWGMYPIHWAAASCFLASRSATPNLTPFKLLEVILEQLSQQELRDDIKDDHLDWNWLNFLTGQDSNNYIFYKNLINSLKYTTDLNGCLKNKIEANIDMQFVDGHGCTLSQLAARNGDAQILDYLLLNNTSEFDYSQTDALGRNILHHACYGGRKAIVERLLGSLSLNTYDDNGQNVLHHACSGGSSIEIVKILVDKPVVDKHIDAKDKGDRNIFHLACGGEGSHAKDIVDWLIDTKRIKDIRAVDRNGWSALHHACQKGNKEIVDKLLKLDFDVHTKNHDKRTPLHLACMTNKDDLVQSLIDRNADVNAIDEEKMTPLHHACLLGNLDVANRLLKKCDHEISDGEGRKALHHAARGGNAKIIEAIIEKGMHPDVQDDKKQTPLHYSCAKGHLQGVKILLAKKANPSSIDIDGRTSLHHACMSGNGSVVDFLLSNIQVQGDIDIADNINRTSLHYAAENGNVDVVTKLLDRRADPRKYDNVSLTPVHIASSKGDLEIVKRLFEANADLEQEDDKGYNALFYAFGSGNVDLCKYLIDKGLDAKYYNAYGHAPYERASNSGEMRSFARTMSESY